VPRTKVIDLFRFRRSILRFFRGHPAFRIGATLSPSAFWLLVFTMIPMGIVVFYSFQTRGPWGTTIFEFSLDSYRLVFDPLFLKIIGRSFKLAALTVVICLAAGYLIAYWIAFYGGRRKNLLLFLVILPFWTSYLVRIYAWMTLLSDHGLINTFLTDWGLIDQPLPLLHNEYSVLVGLVYTYLPFMILPLYSVMKTIPPAYLRAAKSLGATDWTAFWRVYFPQTVPGIGAGAILCFILAIGYYITPELVGGTSGIFISNRIAYHISSSLNWGLGAALGVILLALVLTLYWIYDKIVGIDNVKLG